VAEKQEERPREVKKSSPPRTKLMSELSHMERLRNIGMNQRFGQSTSNMLGRLVKSRKEHDKSKADDKPEYFYEARVPPTRPIDMSDSFMVLADETPSERRFGWPSQEDI
jgi:hypothetical protein